MDVTTLTFNIKDVVMIVGGTITLAGSFFGLKFLITQNKNKVFLLQNEIKGLRGETEKKLTALQEETEEKFMHVRNARKAHKQEVMNELKETKAEHEKKELQIYAKINEVRDEQRKEHSILSNKMDDVIKQIGIMGNSVAELTGFLKGAGKI